jgi:hypothetical protein
VTPGLEDGSRGRSLQTGLTPADFIEPVVRREMAPGFLTSSDTFSVRVDQILLPLPIQIAQSRGITFILFEEFNHFRHILTDGRNHPADMNPSWFGYSVGRWVGDAFVVDTRGFRDGLWLDGSGHTATDQLRTMERGSGAMSGTCVYG